MTVSDRAPLHNSGAELSSRSDAELEQELKGSFPGGKRWEGITYELQRRAGRRQERLILWTLLAAVAAVVVGAIGAFK
jgi:hypothetical protein